MQKYKLPFTTLLLLISFASINAVLFIPALPTIAKFFQITASTAQQTISWYLVGYAFNYFMARLRIVTDENLLYTRVLPWLLSVASYAYSQVL